MNIVFDPPIGQAVHVGVSSLIAKIRPTVLLFTARLNVRDYDTLVKDKGRVQLWSDIPHDGAVGGGWHQLEFQESTRELTVFDDDPTTISLNGPSIRPVGEDKILCLAVRLPAGISSLLRFQFTYRIAYPAERTVWMGNYRQNGTVVLDDLGVRSTNGLRLTEGWSWSESRRGCAFEVEHGDGVEALKVESAMEFRLLALGKQCLLPDLKEASLLCFIPRTQPHLTLRSTYILSASPGLSLSVRSDGVIALFGTGTALLEAHDMHSDPSVFLERLIKHGNLNSWKIIPSDPASQSVLLASRGPMQPLSGVVIPFFPSEHLIRPLSIPYLSLVEAYNADPTHQFALFVPYNLKIHLLDPTAVEPSGLTFQFDATNSEFVLSPVFRLRSSSAGAQKVLGVAILTPYSIVPAPSPLPTPPPSPSVSSNGHLEQSWASVDTSIASVELSPDAVEAPQELSIETRRPTPGHREPTSANADAHKAVIRRTPSPAQSRTLFAWLVRSLLVSMTTFWHLLLRMLCLRFLPFQVASGGSETSRVQEDGPLQQPELEELDDELDDPQIRIMENEAPLPQGHTLPQEIQPVIETTNGSPETALKVPNLSLPKRPSFSISDHQRLFAELFPSPEDLLIKSSTTSTIAFFAAESFPRINQSDETAPELNGEHIEHAVRFVGESITSQPECSVSTCDLVVHDHHQHPNSLKSGNCVLLEFQLNWESGQGGKTVSISVPPDVV